MSNYRNLLTSKKQLEEQLEKNSQRHFNTMSKTRKNKERR